MAAPERNFLLQAALAYAAADWPVFPCSPDTKRPLTQNGFKDATTEAAALRQWWARWPDAMIGLPTGRATGLLVVDLDPKAPQTAEQLLAELRQAVGEALPPCPLLRTPRAGLHLYLAYPTTLPEGLTEDGEIGNRAGIIPGVDLRGQGGYVIAAPSVRQGPKAQKDGTEGKAYAFEEDASPDDLAPPAASENLLRFLVTKQGQDAAQAPPTTRRAPTADDKVRKYALAALDRESRSVAGAGKGQRNQALNDAALKLGSLVGAGALSEAVVWAALEEAAGVSGLTKDDGLRSVRATLKSGLKAGIARPRDLSDVTRPADRGRPGGSTSSRPSRGSGAGLPAEGGGAPDDNEPDPDVLARCAGQPQNDTGNGHRLRAHFGGDFIAVREVGPHIWTGSHWEPEGAKEALFRMAQETAARIEAEGGTLALSEAEEEIVKRADGLDRDLLLKDGRSMTEDEKRQKAAIKAADKVWARFRGDREDYADWAVASGMAPRLRAMVDCALAHCTEPPEAMDAEPLAINIANGTLRVVKAAPPEPDPDKPETYSDVRRWAVRLDAHSRQDRFAKALEVTYDPEAACPKWQAFVDRFQPKPALQRFLRAFHGYSLTGLTGEQVFVFNYGHGANGKSTFMEAIARLMGPYAQVLPVEAITGDSQRRGDQATPEFARLPGARLVRCAELPRGQGFRETTLKMLTGGEPILVRHLHQGFFEFRPRFKVIGSGNSKPNIGGVDEGIWRRMRLVPWEVTIPDKEQRPMERVLRDFANESPGILNWLIEGLIDYLQNGLVVPPEIQAATGAYRNEMDPVGEFLAACVAVAPEESVTARDLYNAYADWCAANSVKPFAERTFATIMGEKGYAKENGRIRRYLDISLKDVPANPDKGGGAWGGPQY